VAQKIAISGHHVNPRLHPAHPIKSAPLQSRHRVPAYLLNASSMACPMASGLG